MRTGISERPDLPLAVVVGAGGMGISIARKLGERHRVMLADIDAGRAEERAAAMRDDGYDATSRQCDITDVASVAKLADSVAASGGFRALAHVAAISPSMGSWEDVLTLNLRGAALVEAAMLPSAGSGSAAVFVSSVAAHFVRDVGTEVLDILDDPLREDFRQRLEEVVAEHTSATAYSLAKLAVNRMCERRASAWGRHGARIVSMSPGLIATPMGALEFSGSNRDSKIELLRRTPVGREGTMIETASAVDFLVSDRASYITGTDLLVDGGIAAAMRFPEGTAP